MVRFYVCAFLLISGSVFGMGAKRPIPTDAPAVDPYYERFKTLGKTYGASFVNDSVKFSFGALIGPAIGLCSYSSAGNASVQFAERAWRGGSDTFREMLSFHELGHCMLGRAHKNTRRSDGRPDSLMTSWMMDEGIYTANRDEYLKELFTAENNRYQRINAALKSDGESCTFGR
jgi:hypothetical protein